MQTLNYVLCFRGKILRSIRDATPPWTWEVAWSEELLGRCWGTHWEQPKSKHPHPLTKETWVHAASPHWLQDFFLPTRVLCHFWCRLMEGAWTSRTSFACYGCTFRPLPVFVTSNMECSLYPEPLTYTWKNGQYQVRDYSNATICVQFSKKLKLAHFLRTFYNFDTEVMHQIET
jgi:hypothetical protein